MGPGHSTARSAQPAAPAAACRRPARAPGHCGSPHPGRPTAGHPGRRPAPPRSCPAPDDQAPHCPARCGGLGSPHMGWRGWASRRCWAGRASRRCQVLCSDSNATAFAAAHALAFMPEARYADTRARYRASRSRSRPGLPHPAVAMAARFPASGSGRQMGWRNACRRAAAGSTPSALLGPGATRARRMGQVARAMDRHVA